MKSAAEPPVELINPAGAAGRALSISLTDVTTLNGDLFTRVPVPSTSRLAQMPIVILIAVIIIITVTITIHRVSAEAGKSLLARSEHGLYLCSADALV